MLAGSIIEWCRTELKSAVLRRTFFGAIFVAIAIFHLRAQPTGFMHLLHRDPISIAGVVVDSFGRTIPGVRVGPIAVRSPLAVMERFVETNAEGHFEFTTLAPTVVFWKEGFEPKFIRITNQQADVRIELKTAPLPEKLGPCREPLTCVVVKGGRLCLPRLKGVHIGDIGGSVDAFERSFVVSTESGKWHMIHGIGASWGGPNPAAREVWSSVLYKERIREGAGVRIVDASGKTSDGKCWRHIGLPGETVFYDGLDSLAGAQMDKVLDGLCLVEK